MVEEKKSVEQPASPEVETPESEPVEGATEVPEEKPAVDRSAYNCTNCRGEGLVDSVDGQVRCSNCGGTGKV